MCRFFFKKFHKNSRKMVQTWLDIWDIDLIIIFHKIYESDSISAKRDAHLRSFSLSYLMRANFCAAEEAIDSRKKCSYLRFRSNFIILCWFLCIRFCFENIREPKKNHHKCYTEEMLYMKMSVSIFFCLGLETFDFAV